MKDLRTIWERLTFKKLNDEEKIERLKNGWKKLHKRQQKATNKESLLLGTQWPNIDNRFGKSMSKEEGELYTLSLTAYFNDLLKQHGPSKAVSLIKIGNPIQISKPDPFSGRGPSIRVNLGAPKNLCHLGNTLYDYALYKDTLDDFNDGQWVEEKSETFPYRITQNGGLTPYRSLKRKTKSGKIERKEISLEKYKELREPPKENHK